MRLQASHPRVGRFYSFSRPNLGLTHCLRGANRTDFTNLDYFAVSPSEGISYEYPVALK